MLGKLPNMISMLHPTASQTLLGASHFIKSHSDSVPSAGNMKFLVRVNSRSLMVTQIVNVQLDGTRSKVFVFAFILSPEVDIVLETTSSRVCTGVGSKRRRIGRNKASILRVIIALGVEEPESRTVSQMLVAGVRNSAFTEVLADLEDCLVILCEFKEVPVGGPVSQNFSVLVVGEFVTMAIG